MKKILIICPFPYGVAAGQRLKYEQSFDYWRAQGYEITISSFMDMDMWNHVYKKGFFLKKVLGTLRGLGRRLKDLTRIHRFDKVYVFMWVTPVGTSLFERLTRKLAKVLIYDIEDNIFIEKANQLNKIAKLIKGSGKTEYLVKAADHVITSSPYLNDYCLERNKFRKCTYISSSIEVDRYIANPNKRDNEKVTIGWTGTFTSMPYLDELRDVFIEVKEQRDFKLLVIGNFEYDFPEMDVDVIQWTKANEITDLQRMDIGVYPLPEEDWVLGKSGLKALQYMAMGIPAVATRIGTAIKIINHGSNGFLASKKEEWVRILIQLIDDAELRKNCGLEARKTIEEKYSVDIIKKQYLQVLNDK